MKPIVTANNPSVPPVSSGGKWFVERLIPQPARGIVALLVLALLPKCLACVAGYAALVTGLGLANPELCGGAQNDAGVFSGPVLLVVVALSVLAMRSVYRFIAFRRTRCPE
jgi:hypothetical protein